MIRRGLEPADDPPNIELVCQRMNFMKSSLKESSRKLEEGRYNYSSEEELVPRIDMGAFN